MDEREKLVEALKTIKETCEKHPKCELCPLGSCDGCLVIGSSPDNWQINAPGEVWRALL